MGAAASRVRGSCTEQPGEGVEAITARAGQGALHEHEERREHEDHGESCDGRHEDALAAAPGTAGGLRGRPQALLDGQALLCPGAQEQEDEHASHLEEIVRAAAVGRSRRMAVWR